MNTTPPRPHSFVLPQVQKKGERSKKAYVLFEVMLALIVFSVAVVGLARSLSETIGVSNSLHQERAIRMGLESFLNEVKAKELSEMNYEIVDETRGIFYSATLEPLDLQTAQGEELDDLYVLTGTASWNNGQDTYTAELTIYRVEDDRR